MIFQHVIGQQETPVISVSSSGLITATAGGKTATQQLTTQGAQTITPGTANKTIASGRYLTGTQTIKGDANLAASNIKSGVSIFGVAGSYQGEEIEIGMISGVSGTGTRTLTFGNPKGTEMPKVIIIKVISIGTWNERCVDCVVLLPDIQYNFAYSGTIMVSNAQSSVSLPAGLLNNNATSTNAYVRIVNLNSIEVGLMQMSSSAQQYIFGSDWRYSIYCV